MELQIQPQLYNYVFTSEENEAFKRLIDYLNTQAGKAGFKRDFDIDDINFIKEVRNYQRGTNQEVIQNIQQLT